MWKTARASISAAGKMWTFLEELENASCWKGIGCYSERNLATWENCQMIQFHLGHIPLWIITQDMSWTSSELTNGVGILALASVLSWWCVCCDHNCANTFARQGNLWLFQLLSVRVNVEAINEGTWIHDAPNRSKPISAWSHLLGGCFYLLLQSRRNIIQLHKIYRHIQSNESKWHQLGFVVVWMESSVDMLEYVGI